MIRKIHNTNNLGMKYGVKYKICIYDYLRIKWPVIR